GGLAAGEGVLLVAAGAVWWRRGRPRTPLAGAKATAARALRDPVVVGFGLVVLAALAYELLLVVAAPPNNWDSLTYHLARVAFWVEHGGIYWVPNAPIDRINAAQPVAEQQILYLSVALGTGTLYALPQFAAELAIMAATYLSARRLGFELRAAACAAFSFASFALVALEATTAQNDLVAAALPAVAASMLVGGGASELVLAGVATGLAIGVKATAVLVLPVLALLALRRGRRAVALYAGAALLAFAALGLWSYALNLSRTGHLLGGEAAELTHASTSVVGTLAMAVAVLYRLADLPGLSNDTAWLLALAGLNLALAAVFVTRRLRRRASVAGAAAVGVPLTAPALTLAFTAALHGIVRLVGLPVDRGAAFLGQNFLIAQTGPFTWQVNRLVQEDIAGFGPVGGLMLVGVSLWAVVAFARRRADARVLALGLALPLFLLLLGATTASYNPYLGRFVLVPAALAVPLVAICFRRTALGLALVAVSALVVCLTLVDDVQKPLDSRYGHPWQLGQVDAARLTYEPSAGDALFDLDYLVPSWAPLAAVLAEDEPSYLLFGATHTRPVVFLPARPAAAYAAARSDGSTFVVIGGVAGVANAFAAHGWAITNLIDPYWQLAIDCASSYVKARPFYPC
ncbi:MAG: glycosyltransferase 87 family protein, partial [Rhizomicrobium sp.]